MAVLASSPSLVELSLSARWIIDVQVTNDDGCAVDVAPVVTVTLPDASTATPTVEALQSGEYRAVYVPAVSTGRYVARAVADGYGAADFVAYVSGTTSGTGMPTVDQLITYLGLTEDDEDEVQFALNTEAASQRDICRVGAVYSDALRGALFRRVARNLALKGLPIMVLRGDGESGDTVLPGNDPEVRRLERPHRKVILR
jgi:hypothetical protein